MDDIVDIDQALSESFCAQSEEACSHVQDIVQQWKQNNKEIVKNKGDKNVDTRTFTRPKKRILTDMDRSFLNNFQPSINLRVGEPVTNVKNNFICDMSPPPSSGTSFDYLTDQMKNSLVTSSDFSNVSYFMDTISDLHIPKNDIYPNGKGTPQNVSSHLQHTTIYNNRNDDRKQKLHINNTQYPTMKLNALSTTKDNKQINFLDDETFLQMKLFENATFDNNDKTLGNGQIIMNKTFENDTFSKKHSITTTNPSNLFSNEQMDKDSFIHNDPMIEDEHLFMDSLNLDTFALQSTPLRSSIGKTYRSDAIANLSPIIMSDTYKENQSIDEDIDNRDTSLIDDDIEFNKLMNNIDNRTNYKNENDTKKILDIIKQKHAFIHSDNKHIEKEMDKTQLISGDHQPAINETFNPSLSTSSNPLVTSTERLLRRTRLHDSWPDHNKTINLNEISPPKGNETRSLSNSSCNLNKTNERPMQNCIDPSNITKRLSAAMSSEPMYHDSDRNCSQGEAKIPVPSNEIENCMNKTYNDNEETYNMQNLHNVYENNTISNGSVNDLSITPIVSKLDSMKINSKIDCRKNEIPSRMRQSNLKPLNKNTKFGFTLKTNSAECLDSESKKLHNDLNIKVSKIKSQSTQNLIEKDNRRLMEPRKFEPLKYSHEKKEANNLETGLNKQLNMRRTGLIRPSSGYFGYTRKPNTDGEPGIGLQNPRIKTPTVYSSNCSLEKEHQIKPTRSINSLDQTVQIAAKTSLQNYPSEPSIEPKSEIIKPRMKSQLAKRSCLPRPMSMINNK